MAIYAFKIVCRASGKVLDVPGNSPQPGLQIQQWEENGGPNQRWEVFPAVGSSYFIRSLGTRLMLDVSGFGTANGTPIDQFPDKRSIGDPNIDTRNQQWNIIPVDNGYYKIVSVWSGKVLDIPGFSQDNGAKLQQFDDNGGTNQQWQLVLVNVIPEGRLLEAFIQSVSSRLVMTTKGAANDGAPVVQDVGGSGSLVLAGSSSDWATDPGDGGYFQVRFLPSGKVLDDPGLSDVPAPLQQFTPNGGPNQRWAFITVGDLGDLVQTKFKILCKQSQLVVDVPGFAASPGTRLQQFNDNGGTNQQWLLFPNDVIP
jgi:hypothetical protein